jgi:hypothetical protein
MNCFVVIAEFYLTLYGSELNCFFFTYRMRTVYDGISALN